MIKRAPDRPDRPERHPASTCVPAIGHFVSQLRHVRAGSHTIYQAWSLFAGLAAIGPALRRAGSCLVRK
jgi:hypothetical protein